MGKKKTDKQTCETTEQVQQALENLQEAQNIQKNVESLIDLIKADGKNYSEHLKKAQNIQKNIESLIDLTLKIQSGKIQAKKQTFKMRNYFQGMEAILLVMNQRLKPALNKKNRPVFHFP